MVVDQGASFLVDLVVSSGPCLMGVFEVSVLVSSVFMGLALGEEVTECTGYRNTLDSLHQADPLDPPFAPAPSHALPKPGSP